MSIQEFNSMGIIRKALFTHMRGEWIATKFFRKHEVRLFLVNDFYVEVTHDPVKQYIDSVEVVKNIEVISQYISDEDLNRLLR